jgi:hypothetical protein
MLDGREQDLSLRKVALAEAQTHGLNSRDNCEELFEFNELRRLLQDAKVDHITGVGRLAILVRDLSKVLVDLGMPPILGLP